jgi:rapamycin-insensitive companion of mTOR
MFHFLMEVSQQFNSNPSSSDPIFSKRRIDTTLTYAYLDMLGELSKYPEGVE